MNIPPKSSPSLSAANSANVNTYSNLNGLAALKKDPNSPQALHAVAQQIDALFLQMMLKSMRDAGAEVGEADSNEMGMYQDMFDKQIALTLSQHQDLGLGAQLTRQLSAAAAASSPPASSAAAPATLGSIAATASASPAVIAALAAAGYVDADSAAALPVDGASAAAVDADGSASDTTGAGEAGAGPNAGEFVSQVFPAIQRAAAALGVSPFAILAQAALETGWGKRVPRGTDGAPSRNLFGIKADDQWSGARVAADTVEFSGGVATVRRTAFRAYDSIEASVHDFARLLASSPRYRDAVAVGANAGAYVDAIGRSGYATDPEYSNKLKGILSSSAFRSAVGLRRVVL